MKNCAVPGRGQARSHVWLLVGVVAVVASACANGGSSTDSPGFGPQTSSGGTGRDASGGASASGGSSSGGGSGSNGGSDDGGASAGDDATAGDDGSGDEAAGDDAAGDDGATDSATSGDDAPSSAPPSYACVTTLASPLPVCDSAHDYCLCTQDTQCNSNGLNGGGCHSGKCSGGSHCSGGQLSDSAGCSVVGATCNINKCPTGTKCEGGPTSGWNKNSDKDLCGTSLQCCWCTSDSACPVSGKCINDATQNQCSGAGPCTGSGTDFDGMHCQLASPGIPMCSTQ
jgi:hypothetical protein